jgi:hypothetical protein
MHHRKERAPSGGFPGTRERPGNRYLPRVFGTGGAARGAGADGQPDGPDRRGGRPAELETVKLGNRPSWTGEAGKPAKLERRGRETGRAGAVRLKQPGGNGDAGKPAETGTAWRPTSRAGAAYRTRPPFISYMKGALLHCAAGGRSVTRDTPA